MEVRGVEQDLMPYVGQLALPNVPIEGWIIDPYADSLLDGPGKDMLLPTNNGEIFQFDMMT